MKKCLTFFILSLLLACDDGDLQIETLDFETGSIQYCSTPSENEASLLFKLNEDEALILELPKGMFKNEVTTDSITSQVPSQSKITYRLFSAKATKNYFCDAIPPVEPSIVSEIIATDGIVSVTTVQDGDSYIHTVKLTGVSLEKEDGSRITDLRVRDFGTVTTK